MLISDIEAAILSDRRTDGEKMQTGEVVIIGRSMASIHQFWGTPQRV